MNYTSEEAERLSWKYVDSDPARRAFVQLAALLRSMEEAKAVAWVADLAPGIERPKEYMGIFTSHKSYADWMATNSNYVITPLFIYPPAESGETKDAAMWEVISNLGDHMEGYSHDPELVEYVTSQLNILQSAIASESREKDS